MTHMIIGDIDSEAFQSFNEILIKVEESAVKKKVLSVKLVSEGGDARIALAFFDRIQRSSAQVEITVDGVCASAAVLILAAGSYRRMARNAWCMVHEDSVSDMSGTVSQLECQVKQLRAQEEQWNAILASVSTTSIAKWEKLHKAETWLTAEQCLQLGLIDEVI